MNRKIELLAPGGDVDAIKAAIVAGADAVYCGLDRFNARNRAENISFDDLQGLLRLAHTHNCELFLTLNIVLVENEIPAIIALLNRLVNTSIDGIIVQDLGLFYILSHYFPRLNVHASTQVTTHNKGQIEFLSRLNVTRVNLCRELNISEIEELTAIASEKSITTEVFVHGSHCISFSGLCYMSSVHGGNSGNRGRCSQPCRDQYHTTLAGKEYPLNIKDNSAFFDLAALDKAGVGSLKIEGRIKKFDYVYSVVDTWRKQLHNYYSGNSQPADDGGLHKVFNRGFSNAFLKGDIDRDMFIDNPRDHSVAYLSEIHEYASDDERERGAAQLFNEKDAIKNAVEQKIRQLNTAKAPLIASVSGNCGDLLKLSVKTPEGIFEVNSKSVLSKTGSQPLDHDLLIKRFKAWNDTEYYIEQIDVDTLEDGCYLPFKELTTLKKEVLYHLIGSKKVIDPVVIPQLKTQLDDSVKPDLSVLISSPEEVYLCNETKSQIYYQLPDSLKNSSAELIELFNSNRTLIPWFPSVMIGEDFQSAATFLEKVKPASIVTNNTGIAYEAYRIGIPWIAGPYLNSTNSYSLKCLKEVFNCCGAFISSELNKNQIRNIQAPENFKLYYSIYHPIVLMTSRQCLFHQVTGCEKNILDKSCISHCEKHSTITNLNETTFHIDKTKGNYHTVYNDVNFLNFDIVCDLPDLFTGFLIDLRKVQTKTKHPFDLLNIVSTFENYISGALGSIDILKQAIHPTTDTQYKKGV